MAIMATDSGGGGDFKKVPPGNHMAICNMVVDLGRQRVQSQMHGESIKHQVYIRWELPDERLEYTDKEGRTIEGPMTIGKSYTLSLHEKSTLRADLANWRGRDFTDDERKGFDIANLAGVPAMVSVIHNDNKGKTYANVSGVAGLPKSMSKPSLFDTSLVYDSDSSRTTFELLPEWLQKKIDGQVVDQKSEPQRNHDDLDDDCPF